MEKKKKKTKEKKTKTEGTGFNWMTAAAFDGAAWRAEFNGWLAKLMAKDGKDGRSTSPGGYRGVKNETFMKLKNRASQ